MMPQPLTATSGPRPPRSWLPDLLAAVVAVAFLVAITTNIPVEPGDRGLDVGGYALLVAAGASVSLVRRYPAWVVAGTTVLLLTYTLREYTGGPVYATGWVGLTALSWRTDRRTALLWATVMAGSLTMVHVVVRGSFGAVALVFIGWSAAAVFLGDALRNRSNYLAQVAERARHLERTREEEARRRVAEDRLRIARDLHDSVAHAMATINVQAGTAAHVADRNPDAARDALATIQRASGDVLDELGAMLRLLRQDGDPADRAPTPDLDRLDELVAATRGAHLHVGVEVEGVIANLPHPVSVAAYRIVQESLTNVVRHAGEGARASVSVRISPDGSCRVTVEDDGRGVSDDPSDPTEAGAATGGTGVGIRGMRERAEATGGTLDARPGPAGGFAVRAAWRAPGPEETS